MTEDMNVEEEVEAVSGDDALDEARPLEEESRHDADDRLELLRRAVFAEESLELSHYIKDKEILGRLRDVITGQTEMELKHKLNVLKDVLVHLKDVENDSRPTEEGFEQMVAQEVERNLDRLHKAAESVDAGIVQPRRNSAPSSAESASSRLSRLAKLRGILLK
ncbi:hypothetical protein J7M28_10470 [bacterium]|nr:hypothetical protein [bacterium]